ncbi:phage portal protein [Ochrobactrum intermedium]|uniref:phage portal protein n=1 Tax=Brucella intermedia TaxID=94625 RepID=UPI00128D0222|nr:phage portal protein [Brucella intermedia]MPR61225.1 phage portal protein [Brucella intermedia]
MYKLLNGIYVPEDLERKAYTTSDPNLLDIFGSTPTVSGVSVSGERALSVSAVLQAVRLISENIGSLPCKLYMDLESGKEQDKDHTAFRIVHNRASRQVSAGQIRSDLTRDALVFGAGFAKVIRYTDGRPFELIRLKPGTVSVYEDQLADLPPIYRVTEADGVTDYPFTEILHIRPFGNKAPTVFGREAIGLSSLLEKHGADLFKNGARPQAVISFGSIIPDSEVGEKTVKRVAANYRAMSRNGWDIPLMLDGDAKYEQMAFTSTDAQYLENRVFQINEISRVFGVPPTMLYELTRGTWSNAEEMSRSFIQLCLRPWLDRWQDAYATVLLTEEEQDEYSFEFVIDDLQRADTRTRAEVFSKLVTNRIMTPNEVRAAMNMPPMEGGDELISPHIMSSATPVTTPAPDISKDISNESTY